MSQSSSTLPEVYVSVDVETAGPNPSQYSLLSIGACLVADRERTFYAELKPVNDKYDPVALSISGLSMEELARRGLAPPKAMAAFDEWLASEVPSSHLPVFVAFNAPFDWMFVTDYFYRYLGRNPFGHAALDIKALYMGMTGVPWARTTMRSIAPYYADHLALSHHALHDALDQADLFIRILSDVHYRAQQSQNAKRGGEE